MTESDKPLGAPNLDAETPPSKDEEMQTATPSAPTKRKLNWKGFGFGIVAVIFIELFAISMLQGGDPEIPIQDPTKEPTKTQISPTINQFDKKTSTSSASTYPSITPKTNAL